MGLRWIGGFPVITDEDDKVPATPLPPLLIAAILVFLLAVLAIGVYMVFHPHLHR